MNGGKTGPVNDALSPAETQDSPASSRLGCVIDLHIWRFVAIAVPAVLLRLVLAPWGWHSFDVGTMQTWAQALVNNPLSDFYSLDLGVPMDHLPGDLWLLVLLGELQSALPGDGAPLSPIAIKAVGIVADVVLGLSLWAIALSLTNGTRGFWLPALGVLFGPGFIMISSVWGQWDALSAALCMLSVLYAVKNQFTGVLPWILLAYACLIKPQLVIVAVFLALSYWKAGGRKGGLWVMAGGVAGILLVQVVCAPFDVGLLPFPATDYWLVEIGKGSADQYTSTTLGAHNFWGILVGRGNPPSDSVPFVFGLSYLVVGLLFMLSTVSLIIAVCVVANDPRLILIWGSGASLLAVFALTTRMHERYLTPAIPFLLVAVVLIPRLKCFSVALVISHFLNVFMAYMTGTDTGWLAWVRSDVLFRLNSVVTVAMLVMVLLVGVMTMLGDFPRRALRRVQWYRQLDWYGPHRPK